MPFKSDKQRKYLFKNKPKVAAKFVKDSKKKKVKKKWKRPKAQSMHPVTNLRKDPENIKNQNPNQKN